MYKILIVDDAETNAEILHSYMSDLEDVECRVFTEPRKALIWAQSTVPDLILLDYQMPDLNGIEFVRLLREQEDKGTTPVIMVTGDESREILLQGLEAGATDFLRKPVEKIELLARARNMIAMRAHQRELVEANRKLRHMATTDSLTGLKNRRYMMERLREQVNLVRRYETACVVGILDIDHFKYINDTYGHDAGDEVLRMFSNSLRTSLRDTDFVARIGGEEFAVLLPQADLQTATNVCQRILTNLRETSFPHPGKMGAITASLGLTKLRPADDEAGVLKRADDALYAAKTGGRDRLVVLDADTLAACA